MFLIVGLGNPGKKYQLTRHNAGFMVMDALAKHMDIKINNIRFQSLIGEGDWAGERVILMKPQTFMNASGEAVRAAVARYDIPIDRILVIYDDKDTPFGSIRLRYKGSGGSHNGMNHIIYQLQTDQFLRLRFGIGASGGEALKDYVLSSFTKQEQQLLSEMVDQSVHAVCTVVIEGMDYAMNQFNKKKKDEHHSII